MTFRAGRPFLHTPGPTPIPDVVLNAMHRQPLDLSDPELIALTESCFADLRKVFRTQGQMFMYASNGHGGWEAALTNLFGPGECVLVPETGHFSIAFADHARALGLDVATVPGDGRRAIDPHAVEAMLRADSAGRIAGVLAVHTDTAAGVTSDLQAIRAAIDAANHPALYVVDAVASLGAATLEMDAWGIDCVISASQKALMGPPGLAIVAAGEKALAKARRTPLPRRYWDWEYRIQAENYRKFCGTAPEYNLFALRAGLDLFFEEGAEAIVARHARLAGAVQAAVSVWSEAGQVGFNAVEPAERSTSVTTILTPAGVPGERVRVQARTRYGVSLGGGLGPLSGKAFRIGHLGAMNEATILGCIGTVEMAMRELGIACSGGAVQAAIEFLAASPDAAPAVLPLARAG